MHELILKVKTLTVGSLNTRKIKRNTEKKDLMKIKEIPMVNQGKFNETSRYTPEPRKLMPRK